MKINKINSVKYINQTLLKVSIVLISICLILIFLILYLGFLNQLKKEATSSNLDSLRSANYVFQSQLATSLSKFINFQQFRYFMYSGESSRKQYSGSVYESFLNSIQSYGGVITGAQIYQNQRTGINQLSEPDNTDVMSILSPSNFHIDIPLAYSQNYYDQNSQFVGFLRVFIDKNMYIKYVFKHYTDLVPCSDESADCISINVFSDKLGIYPLQSQINEKFQIKAQDALPKITNIFYLYIILIPILIFITFILLAFFLNRILQKNVFSPLTNLNILLINKDSENPKFIDGIEEINEAYTIALSLLETIETNKDNFHKFQQAVTKQAYTDIHEVKNYINSVKNYLVQPNKNNESKLKLIESAEERIFDYLKKYKKVALSEAQEIKDNFELSYLSDFTVNLQNNIKKSIADNEHNTIKLFNDFQKGNHSNKLIYLPENQLLFVITNLIQNSLQSQYFGERKIELNMTIDEKSLIIDVSDNGVGFDSERVDNYFEGHTSKERGTGFGLSRCQEIIKSVSGTIELADNIPGDKVTVRVSLPIFDPVFSDIAESLIKIKKFKVIVILTSNPEYYCTALNHSNTLKKIFTNTVKFHEYIEKYYFSFTTCIIIDFEPLETFNLNDLGNYDNVYILTNEKLPSQKFTVFDRGKFKG